MSVSTVREQIAKKINDFGVEMIECGHPLVSDYEKQRVAAVIEVSNVPVLCHARCNSLDIDAVAEVGAEWVGLFLSFSDLSLSTKFAGEKLPEMYKKFEESISYAKKLGLKVRATIEDAARTPDKRVLKAIQFAKDAKVDRVCYADSVGELLPDETFKKVQLIRKTFPNVALEYHVHNDRGFALANTLKAIEAGVLWVSTSVNGVGERAGITDTIQLAALLVTRFGYKSYNLELSKSMSKLVEAYGRISVSQLAPYVGDNAFHHACRLHELAMKRDVDAYSVVVPDLFKADITYGKEPIYKASEYILKPFEKSATELQYHRHGQGHRHVMLDYRLYENTPYYIISRKVTNAEPMRSHVDPHIHNCDSVFLFLGSDNDYKGLNVEVHIDGETVKIESPATVFIPAGKKHTYRLLGGSGTFINFVNKPEYNSSLLEE